MGESCEHTNRKGLIPRETVKSLFLLKYDRSESELHMHAELH